MGRENHRAINSLPQQPPMASAPAARFMVGWWERQVHVWVLRKPATELLDSAGDGVDIDENRKLLKSIVIKGDSNITSATVNRDGTLLVVSTAVDVKAFRLRHQVPAKPSDVEVSTVELPRKLTHLGASLVKLSPNGRWLCLVQEGSRVLVAAIPSGREAPESPPTSIKTWPLKRLRREIPQHITRGCLGRYARSITQADFSPDSFMLAMADLAGYIDTWILAGVVEGTRNGTDGEDGNDASSSSSSSSDGDSSGEEEAVRPDERWMRNPTARLLPKLPSAPVVLSFSDSMTEGMELPAAREMAADGKRDYTLAVITSSWQILAFHPRHATLTPWCRRHPRSSLPAAVQDLLDLAKGIMWQNSRMWVYGVSFLLMLDMGQDMKPTTEGVEAAADTRVAHETKRKRTGLSSGAGGINEKENLMPHKIRRHGSGGHYVDMDVSKATRGDESDGDEEAADDDDWVGKAGESVGSGAERKKWWITFKYRPILGMVPLNMADQPLEAALVERPSWKTEMAERYVVDDEGER